MMSGISMATDSQTRSHTPAKIGDDKHRYRALRARRDDNSNPPRPPPPRTSRKSTVREAVETDRGPTVREYMTSDEFRSWVSDMGYPKKQGMTSVDRIPYKPDPICRDLGIQLNQFYSYWRGTEKGRVVTIKPSVTRLCMCLLARRRAAALMDDLVRAHPECGVMIRQIVASLVMPSVTGGGTVRRVVALDARAQAEVNALRERATLLRRTAIAASSGETRRRIRMDAEELEARALKIEEGGGITPTGPAPGSRPAERDKSRNDDPGDIDDGGEDDDSDPDDLGDWDTED